MSVRAWRRQRLTRSGGSPWWWKTAAAPPIVGMEAAAGKPDGYTVIMGNVGTIAINNSLYRKLPYDHETACCADHFVETCRW